MTDTPHKDVPEGVTPDSRIAGGRQGHALDSQRLRADLERAIAARERAEEQLRRVEGRLRLLCSCAPVILFAVDRNGIVTLAEGKGLEKLGARPADVIGHSAFEICKA